MGEDEKILKELERFEIEHRSLDGLIEKEAHLGQLHIQRLKKRKLWLKDEISRLHSFLCPDIIA